MPTRKEYNVYVFLIHGFLFQYYFVFWRRLHFKVRIIFFSHFNIFKIFTLYYKSILVNVIFKMLGTHIGRRIVKENWIWGWLTEVHMTISPGNKSDAYNLEWSDSWPCGNYKQDAGGDIMVVDLQFTWLWIILITLLTTHHVNFLWFCHGTNLWYIKKHNIL